MKYNFDSFRPRFGVGSGKWDEIREVLGDNAGDIVPFSVADMDFETAPEIREGLKNYIDKYILGYSYPTDEFKNEVCRWYERRHAWTIKPEWICSSRGVVDGFYAAVKAYTDVGDGVMLMTPTYYPMYTAITSNGRKIIESPLINNNGHYEINWEDFENKADEAKLLLLCSPHNPVGRVWTAEELERIGKICINKGVIVCSDEIHSDIIMPGFVHTVFAKISDDFANNCIICTAPSKTFNLAGLQTSNIMIPNPELREKYNSVLSTVAGFYRSNILGYEANRIAYSECEEWLNECLKVIHKNFLTVQNFVKRELPEIIVTPLEGTYLAWLDFRAFGIDGKKLSQILKTKAKLFFDDGFMFGKLGEGFERWSLACPTRYVEEGLERLKDTLKNS